MKLNLKLSHKALILIGFPLICELIFVGTLIVTLDTAEKELKREETLKRNVSGFNDLMQEFYDAAANLYGYKKTKSPIFLARFEKISEKIPEDIRTLKRILVGYPEMQEAISKIDKTGNRALELLAKGRQLSEGSATDAASAQQAIATAKETEAALNTLVVDIGRFVETQKQSKSDETSPARRMVGICMVIGVSMNVILAIALALYFNRGTVRRLNVVVGNTSNLKQGKALTDPIGGGDEIARLDNAFHEMADALAEAAQHKKELIAMVTHDLRTPLTSIQGALTLLREGVFGELTPKATNQVEKAEGSATRLINLINDLLDIERMEAGKLEMHPELTTTQTIFERTIGAISTFAEQKGISIATTAVSHVVMADEDRVIQVLVNLISNSVKFSEKGTTIKLSAKQTSPGFITLSVTDQGRGIPKEFVSSVFERFQQVQKGDAVEKKGTGLGLAICKAIVEGHGGTIGVESEVGVGSTFWFTLPAG